MGTIDKQYDVVVVGGGIIGLATSMKLTQDFPNLKVAVLEKEKEVAQHQTGHNSGVIHAGIYYAPGSQKANFCSTGGKLLRDFCNEYGIPYDMCGKLIVATDDSEIPQLEELFKRGTENGAEGLRMVDQEEIKEIEPYSAGVKAILSPNTGIIDYFEVSQAYATRMRENGGDLLTNVEVISIENKDGLVYLETTSGTVVAKYVLNCAGLHADTVARMMGVDVGVKIVPFRGEYFSIIPEKEHMVKGLIYPVPNPSMPFLGVHFTRRINGSVEAGPNAVFAFAREGYKKTDVNLKDTLGTLSYSGFWKMSAKYWKVGMHEQYRSLVRGVFVKSLQKLMPEITGDDLGDPGAGVRAQVIDSNGGLLQDFAIEASANAIHVLSAPSPGATSSLTISEYIVDLAQESFDLSAA
ncbi:MAG: L-2-hydroxyglutarate oxidase [SAR202 cluster bacterium]|jgi:L-2-hydroxyglutarate oxidase LhgO|nr:L-2-hydroxyglutarate oxidase [SAR202 cluster bacterium]HJO60250.1 L-2-hydroxyglutarate oxidase [SAR202 cluster bacterium]|tara:strand:- start:1446 stop:2672 length:1227 start_codon:yes stop_codon:yes gene_type:complete